MFITVQFGDCRTELFNLNCRMINFIHNLKERCDLDPKDCVDLMDRSGELMNLNEREQSVEQASCVLRERQGYVLLRVCSDAAEGHKYIPLLNDLGRSHPELAGRKYTSTHSTEDVLRKMSNPKERDRKGGPSRKGWSQRDSSSVTPARSKALAGNKKSHPTKQ